MQTSHRKAEPGCGATACQQRSCVRELPNTVSRKESARWRSANRDSSEANGTQHGNGGRRERPFEPQLQKAGSTEVRLSTWHLGSKRSPDKHGSCQKIEITLLFSPLLARLPLAALAQPAVVVSSGSGDTRSTLPRPRHPLKPPA